ncbi:MAG: hypothetical protein AAFZ15_30830 [Bacteroidota bacterium]
MKKNQIFDHFYRNDEWNKRNNTISPVNKKRNKQSKEACKCGGIPKTVAIVGKELCKRCFLPLALLLM